jgi:transformation/transcription domain-associated protein
MNADGAIVTKRDGTAGPSQPQSKPSADASHGTPSEAQRAQGAVDLASFPPMRQAWEHVEEVVQILKTAFPLLILSMETMVEQINLRFKATPEEEIYRLICMLLQDAMQVGPSKHS